MTDAAVEIMGNTIFVGSNTQSSEMVLLCPGLPFLLRQQRWNSVPGHGRTMSLTGLDVLDRHL